ncbi:hypothetical protein CNMCM6106_000302 [Aspergillus hiratsukae]|uniref:Uncharacterized protein n=1 Tax=Aspergillus hiratsukae TaxID=1194566 RepID=A0A8H6PL18_9EURO|nr:hypothetical protein CNMCM6106_000302 [Aspergillus hiratsukae]
MKTVTTILTMTMAMTALAIPYQNVARDNERAETDTVLMPTPTTKLFPPAESAEKVHVHIHSTHRVLVTVTPAPSSSSSSDPGPSSNSAEGTDGKKEKVGLV